MAPRPGPGPALISRHDVVRAACHIADTKGLDAVSMRAVGKEMGVVPMGHYRHVADKKTLPEAMVELVSAEHDLGALHGKWSECLVQLARQQKALIEPHPWLPALASRYHPLGPATLACVERVLELLDQAGVPHTSQLETVGLFNGLVTTLSAAADIPPQTVDSDHEDDLAALPTSRRYPRLAALAGQPHLDLEQGFDRLGLRPSRGSPADPGDDTKSLHKVEHGYQRGSLYRCHAATGVSLPL